MSRKIIYKIPAALVGVVFVFGLGVAVGQQSAPTENKGVKLSPPTVLDLSQEIDGVQGRQLRLRVLAVEPGGVVAVHSHKGRPAVAYMVQGTLTEYREGEGAKERHAGDSFAEGKEITHWWENKGDQSVLAVAVDVFKP